MKRPILGLLAAAMLSLGLLASSPVQAATTYAPTAVTAHPVQHDGDDDGHGHKYSAHDGQGGTRHHGDDDDGHGHRGRGPCSGLIVLFCRG